MCFVRVPYFFAGITEDIFVDGDFLCNAVFSPEAAFHLSEAAVRHVLRVWKQETCLETMRHARNNAEVSAFAALCVSKVCGLSVAVLTVVAGTAY